MLVENINAVAAKVESGVICVCTSYTEDDGTKCTAIHRAIDCSTLWVEWNREAPEVNTGLLELCIAALKQSYPDNRVWGGNAKHEGWQSIYQVSSTPVYSV